MPVSEFDPSLQASEAFLRLQASEAADFAIDLYFGVGWTWWMRSPHLRSVLYKLNYVTTLASMALFIKYKCYFLPHRVDASKSQVSMYSRMNE